MIEPFNNPTFTVFRGESEIGWIEYVGIRGSGGTRYGFRPVGSTRTRLLTKAAAAELLARSDQGDDA